MAGLKNPTLDVSKAIAEAKAKGKGECLFISPSANQDPLLISHNVYTAFITLYIFLLFLDADNKPADDLTKLANIDVKDILSKTGGISKGILFHVCQLLLKEWEADSLGVLVEDMMQELLMGVTTQN